MEQLNPKSRRDAFGSKINRAHSPVLLYGIPIATILMGSLCAFAPIIAPAPVLPPLGLIVMLSWRFMRPGLLPLWAGLPFGLFDDLFSGQPFGSGILLFSVILIAVDLMEMRFPWRGFWHDWAATTVILAIYLPLAGLFSGANFSILQIGMIMPQLLLSILIFPIISRMVALLDRLRLMRIRRIG